MAPVVPTEEAIAAMIEVATEVTIAAETVAVVGAGAVLAGVAVAAAAAVVAVEEDRRRVGAICLLRSTLRHKVIVIHAVVLKIAVVTIAAAIAAPTTVLPAPPWRRWRTTISFSRASRSPSIARDQCRLPSSP